MFHSTVIAQIQATINTHTSVGAMLIDITDFMQINVVLGFENGDRVIALVYERLTALFTGQIKVLRYHGDKFIALFPAVVNAEKLDAYARMIVHHFSKESVLFNSLDVPVDVRVAFTSTEQTGDAGRRILEALEWALRDLKKSKNDVSRSSIVSQGFEHNFRQVARYGAIRDALKQNQFVNNYQPIVDLKSGLILGCESLVRWHNPCIGSELPPSTFLPHITRHTQLVQLTLTVMRNVIADFSSVISEFPESFYVAINVPPSIIMDASALKRVLRLLERSNLPMNRVSFEVTEQEFQGNIKDITEACKRVHERGIKLLIDDFGTGHSSIERIAHLPLHGIKVDKQFLLRRDNKDINSSVIRFAKDIAQKKQAIVICEGIENEVILQDALGWDVSYGQGFHFARPAFITDFLNQYMPRSEG